MTTPVTLADARMRGQQALSRAVSREIRKEWRRVNPKAIVPSWAALVLRAVVLLTAGQRKAAEGSSGYVAASLTAQGIDPAAVAEVAPEAFSGTASDGRDLSGLLLSSGYRALQRIAQGTTTLAALKAGAVELDMITRTQIADAGRVADGVAVAATRSRPGYVRMLELPSCSRCVVLAGKFYRYNAGFLRHPRCDCLHIPTREDLAGDLRTDPRAYFDSLSKQRQDEIFTESGAQAIRDGADMSQVVNARKGAAGLSPAGARITEEERRALIGGRNVGRLERTDVFGHQLFITTEGTTVRGTAGRSLSKTSGTSKAKTDRYRRARAARLMPESIYEIASDREDAIRLLKYYGYLR